MGRACFVSVGVAGVLLGCVSSAHAGLTFTTTFDSSFDPAAMGTINNVLAQYSSMYSDNVNVSLKLSYSGAGLGTSTTYSFGVGYQDYYNALLGDATTTVDATALANTPGGASNPVNGTGTIWQGRAGLEAVGIHVDTSGISNYFDGEIDLNLGICNYDRVSIDSNKYDLQAVFEHELNEVLGTISNVGESDPRPMDLFRYTSAGARTFTTSGDDAFFSIDGGTTLLAQFNQDPGGDYGDWWSLGGHTPQVQDAFSTPGATPDLGVELIALDAIGWTPVPTPGSASLLAVAGLIGIRRRR